MAARGTERAGGQGASQTRHGIRLALAFFFVECQSRVRSRPAASVIRRPSPSPRFADTAKRHPGQGTAQALRSRPLAARRPEQGEASLMRAESAVACGLLFEGEITRVVPAR